MKTKINNRTYTVTHARYSGSCAREFQTTLFVFFTVPWDNDALSYSCKFNFHTNGISLDSKAYSGTIENGNRLEPWFEDKITVALANKLWKEAKKYNYATSKDYECQAKILIEYLRSKRVPVEIG